MAGRRINVIDLRELVRRCRLGHSNAAISRDLGASRTTVRTYRRLAAARGWLEEGVPLASLGDLQAAMDALRPSSPAGPTSTVEPWKGKIEELRKRGVEMMALWKILREDFGYPGSYSSVRRYIHRLEPEEPETFLRIETRPGEEAQVDFGSAGRFVDSRDDRERKAWVFVMTLGWSRHLYAELVFDQKVETWIALHVRAFEYFGGVPRRLVIDNLKSAITEACFHDPLVQQSYREAAEHYGFTIAPCRVRVPRHKGKVESAVHYVKRNALAGREFRDLRQGNEHLRRWINETAGVRLHGTIKERPLERFEAVERGELLPLPPNRYEPGVWKEAKLHHDCHLVFDGSYYSAPYRLVGQKLMVRATAERVEIYHRWEHVAAHPRATRPGQRLTNEAHLPPQKVLGLLPLASVVRAQALGVGEATAEFVERLRGARPVDRLRGARGVVALARRHGRERLEKACRRALFYDNIRYPAVRSILRQGLEGQPLPEETIGAGPLPRTSRYVRRPVEYAAACR
jgi:transposase